MSKLKLIFEKQLWHYLLLLALLVGLVVSSSTQGFLTDDFLNLRTKTWFLLAAALTIVHQFYVWVHCYCTEKPDMRRIYGTCSFSESG